MALVPCKECKAQISSGADKCPQCGAKQRASVLKSLVVGVFAIFVVLWLIGVATDPGGSAQSAVATPEKIKREADFQRVVLVARSLKAASKNPDSFKLESAILTPGGTVCVVYRATNSFNAVVPGYASSRDGKISTSAAEWNRLCANEPGDDFKHARQAL